MCKTVQENRVKVKQISKIKQIYIGKDGFSFKYYNANGTPFNNLPKETQADILKQALEENKK